MICATCLDDKSESDFYETGRSCKKCKIEKILTARRQRNAVNPKYRTSKYTPKHYNAPVRVVAVGLPCRFPCPITLEVGKVYKNSATAAMFTGIHKNHISAQLNGRTFAARGVRFEFINQEV